MTNETGTPPPRHGDTPLFIVVVTVTPLLATKTAMLLPRATPSSTTIDRELHGSAKYLDVLCQKRPPNQKRQVSLRVKTPSPLGDATGTSTDDPRDLRKRVPLPSPCTTTPKFHYNMYHYRRRDRKYLYRRP